VLLHYGKKRLFWSLIFFGYLSFATVQGQTNRFQQLCMHKIFLNHKLPRIPCLGETHIKLQWYTIFLLLFYFYCFCNTTFLHSSYVIKPPQPSSAIYGAPPFTGNPTKLAPVKRPGRKAISPFQYHPPLKWPWIEGQGSDLKKWKLNY